METHVQVKIDLTCSSIAPCFPIHPRTTPGTSPQRDCRCYPTLARSDSLWSSQRHPLQDGLGHFPLGPSNCICTSFSAHVQQPPAPHRDRLKPNSSARCSLQTATAPPNPPSPNCRIGVSRRFFLSERKSRGDLVQKPVSASHPSSPLNARIPFRRHHFLPSVHP